MGFSFPVIFAKHFMLRVKKIVLYYTAVLTFVKHDLPVHMFRNDIDQYGHVGIILSTLSSNHFYIMIEFLSYFPCTKGKKAPRKRWFYSYRSSGNIR